VRIWSVDPGDPFLVTLAARVLDGTLWPGGVVPDDPLALADVTIYLPTRRAGRALATAFLDLSGRRATVLPRIEPLGDAEDEAGGPGVVSDLEARVALARLVRLWARLLEGAPGAEEDARVLVPSAGPDAVRLADELLALIDQVETQEADWSRLPDLVEDADLAGHWQLTTRFLDLAVDGWARHLAETGRLTPAAARRRDAELAAQGVARAKGPMIVAGSTGSIPATRRLIRAIAESPLGAVVLPGFDREAPAEAWAALETATDAPGHPQYGMKQLVDALGVAPRDVARLAPPTEGRTTPHRAATLRAALRPAPLTGRWLDDRAAVDVAEALAGVALVEADDEREEAAAVAVAMRESVERGETVALVTPHRALARRAAHILTRWGIAVDDSAGEPLDGTPAGILARLVTIVAADGGAADWLALLKHRDATFGLDEDVRRRGVVAVERMFRGPRLAPGAVFAAMRDSGAAAAAIAGPVEAALAPLLRLPGREESVARLARAHADALAAVSPGADATADRRKMEETLEELARHDLLAIPPRDWPATFEALISGIVVRGPLAEDAVRILGPLEARLQAFDHAVLGGLNEGIWPALPDAGPWMSRGMMADFGIDLPERRIGLAAHDVFVAACQPRVTLTRARKAAGEPTVASRWWQRLVAFAGDGADAARARGVRLCRLAAGMDRRAPVAPPPRPQPRPPVEARPTSFTVTEVARLVRDPYAVYARRVLGLDPLEPLEQEPGAGDRGEIVHEVLARFVREGHHRAPDAEVRFRRIAREVLEGLAHAPEAQALWGARLAFVAPAVVAAETGRADRAAQSLVEGKAEAELAPGILLRGRFDRIDIAAGGAVEIIDYKTGAAPTGKEVKAFFEPQLPLEAALVRAGAVEGVDPEARIAGLTYVRLAAGRVAVEWKTVAGDEAGELAEEARARFEALAALYADPATGYLSRARVQYAAAFDGDFDHLARAAEWSAADRNG